MLRPLPRWVIVVGIPLMVVVAAGAVWVLLGTGAGGDQLDAIRTGSALGVGLGGIVVLWLAARRQRSTELDLLQKYEAHQLAERVAAAGERDATARRITDLYAKAVDQLGSDKAPVRLGGLYALERLAQDNVDPQLRQTVVNMICAYLRMPSLAEEPHEREVRLTAQRILENHLKPGPDPIHPVSTFWPGIDLNLTGAVLADLNLSGSRIRDADFHRVKFTGQAMFDHVTFGRLARFSDAEFSRQAGFADVTFVGFAKFTNSVFRNNVWFNDGEFGLNADFGGATYTMFVNFHQCHFGMGASFEEAMFGGGASFEGSTFATSATVNAIARVDGVTSDEWWWPAGWVSGGEPTSLAGKEGLWVSLVPVD